MFVHILRRLATILQHSKQILALALANLCSVYSFIMKVIPMDEKQVIKLYGTAQTQHCTRVHECNYTWLKNGHGTHYDSESSPERRLTGSTPTF